MRDTRYPHEFLDARIIADRNDKPSAKLQLILQRLGNLGPAGRHDDRIVRRVLGPTARAVRMEHMHIAIAEI